MYNLKALERIRLKKGLSQEQVASVLGVHKSTWNRIEKGNIHLKASQLPQVAKALGVSLNDLNKALFFEIDVA